MEGHSTKYLASALQRCQVHYKNKERLRNHHRLEETKEMCSLNAMWYPTDSLSRKNVSGKPSEIQIKSVVQLLMSTKVYFLGLDKYPKLHNVIALGEAGETYARILCIIFVTCNFVAYLCTIFVTSVNLNCFKIESWGRCYMIKCTVSK